MKVHRQRKQIDWERIEPGWRQGILSVLQIAADYEAATGVSVSHTAINKHFKNLKVPRDLTAKDAGRKFTLPATDMLDRAGFVYVIYLDDTAGERFFKIGMAAYFHARFDAHQCSSPFDICVACVYFASNMRAEENALHRMFAEKKIRGEWFRLNREDLRIIAQRAVLT